MGQDIEKIYKSNRKKQKKKDISTKRLGLGSLTKFLYLVILTLLSLILLKKSDTFKKTFYENVYEKSFSFAPIKEIYQKYFGNILPLQNVFSSGEKPVFSEEFMYQNKETYLDGMKFTVDNQYLMPVLESGMVVFIGEKEGYGNTIIVQQVDGVDAWYSNVEGNIKLYDYIEKGDVLGEVNGNYMYLVLKKDGTNINYEDYT